jgi:hypothetical protein
MSDPSATNPKKEHPVAEEFKRVSPALGGGAVLGVLGTLVALGFIKSPQQQIEDTVRVEKSLSDLAGQVTAIQTKLSEIDTRMTAGQRDAMTVREFRMWLNQQKELNPEVKWSEVIP